MNAPQGSAQADELEHWAILIEGYEEKNFTIPPPHPIDILKFRMDQLKFKIQFVKNADERWMKD